MRGELTFLVAAASCGAFVAVAEPLAIVLLRRASAMDLPNERSSHAVPTPRGGGMPIALGLIVVALVMRNPAADAFAIAVSAFAAIGFADDLKGLRAGRRLILQAMASVTVAVTLVAPLHLRPAALVAAAALIAIWVASVVNAFNFMDGVNGISAAHAVIGGAAFACLGALRPDAFLVAVGGAVATGALAFLPWNALRARVFLGDVGSYGLGAALAVLAVCAVIRGLPVEAALGPLALYLADTGWTLQRRIRSGERWLEAHRTHIYQQWCEAGWSHQRVTAVTAAATLLICLLGMASLTGATVIRAAADLAVAAVLAAYLRSPELIGRLAPVAERA